MEVDFVVGELKAALSNPALCQGRGPVTVLVMHAWVTHDAKPVWGKLCPPIVGEGRSQEKQLGKWGEREQKRERMAKLPFLAF